MDSLIRWHEDLASCTIGTHHYLYGGRGSLGVAPIFGVFSFGFGSPPRGASVLGGSQQ